VKGLVLSIWCLVGCAEAAAPPPTDPQAIAREAEIDAWCGDPRLDQQSLEWCATRAAYQRRTADQAQADRQAAKDDRVARRDRAAALRQALAPMQQPLQPIPAPAPARTCTSLVNGQIVSTTCY
jgi:hypothetical protein